MTSARNWLKMGVELEGGWDTEPNTVAKRCIGAKVNHDGSVEVPDAMFSTEIITRPHETIPALIKDIEALYPDHVNESCGFHIHTSFSPMNTSCLGAEAFWTYFKTRWEIWGRKIGAPAIFWTRLAGKPTGPRRKVFCEAKFIPEEQLKNKDDRKRYTALNFVAWHKFRTVECRILPMFERSKVGLDMMRSSIEELASIYETFLNEVGFRPIELEKKCIVNLDEIEEVYEYDLPDRTEVNLAFEATHQSPQAGDNITYKFDNRPDAVADMWPFQTHINTTVR